MPNLRKSIGPLSFLPFHGYFHVPFFNMGVDIIEKIIPKGS